MSQELVERLDDPREKVRAEAAAALVEHCRQDEEGRQRYCMRFLTLLHDEAPAVRGQAVVGAVLCDDELAHLDRVMRLLDDPSPGVRMQVVHTVGPLGLREYLDDFARKLDDADRWVRLACASALATSGDDRGWEVLVAALEKRNMREEALHALRLIAGQLQGPARDAAEKGGLRIFGGVFSSRFDRIAAAGLLCALARDEARRYLLERVQRKKAIDRPMAIELAGELALEGAEGVVGEVAIDRREPLRGTALRALASIAGSRALELCSAALFDEQEDPDVRCDAAEGLLLLGTEDAAAMLRRSVQESADRRVAKVAEVCLALVGKPPAEIRLYLPLTGDEVF